MPRHKPYRGYGPEGLYQRSRTIRQRVEAWIEEHSSGGKRWGWEVGTKGMIEK
jgi:hypothetical protein